MDSAEGKLLNGVEETGRDREEETTDTPSQHTQNAAAAAAASLSGSADDKLEATKKDEGEDGKTREQKEGIAEEEASSESSSESSSGSEADETDNTSDAESPSAEEDSSSSSSSEDEEEEEEEEEEDEEDEPKLKYQRLAGTLPETLKNDAVSTMAVSDRFLALGTHWGVVHILDLNGNSVKSFPSHSATVNEVCIDTHGEYVASASDDGKVVVNSLYTPEQQVYKYKRPMKAVCLEPDYAKKQTRQLVLGGTSEELLMSGKGWFGGSRDVVLHSGEGPIWTVKWRGQFVAWANEAGVKIYDAVNAQKFAYIDRPVGAPRADLYKCCLCWRSDEEILVGWADSVKIGVVKERSKMDVASGLPAKYVEIVCQFRTDFIVCGIAPIQDDILLLSFITDPSTDALHLSQPSASFSRPTSQPPEIHVLDRSGNHLANDVLSVFGYEHYRASDYKLAYLPSFDDNPAETAFYIVSPKDIIVARPRDLDDHIEWLVGKARYVEALGMAENAAAGIGGEAGEVYRGRLKVEDVVEIGVKYLKSLVEKKEFAEAAGLLPKILRGDVKLWEEWIYVFCEKGQMDAVRGVVPVREPRLGKDLYEMILSQYLNRASTPLASTKSKEDSYASFLDLVRTWPADIYDPSIVLDAVQDILGPVGQEPTYTPLYLQPPSTTPETSTDLLQSAVLLATEAHRYDIALLRGLQLGTPGVVKLVRSHNLFAVVAGYVPLLMAYDTRMVELGLVAKPTVDERMSGFGFEREDEEEGKGGISESLRRLRLCGWAPGVQLLVGNVDRIPVAHVVRELEGVRRGGDRWLHVYLDALFRREPVEGAGWHSRQIELYASFDPTRLLDFLRSSASYDVQAALDICEKRDMVPEMVYLLGKMGNNRKALALVIERLGDVKRAIEFAKEQNDDELWEDLLMYSMDKPAFIVGLLENLGSYIDPIKLIQRIPNGLTIPGLRNALIKVMTDYGVQMSLREGCQKILISDTVELMTNYQKSRRRGAGFSVEDLKCTICDDPISLDGANEVDTFVFFFCSHVYHTTCLEALTKSRLNKIVVADKPLSPNSSTPNSPTPPLQKGKNHHHHHQQQPKKLSDTVARNVQTVYGGTSSTLTNSNILSQAFHSNSSPTATFSSASGANLLAGGGQIQTSVWGLTPPVAIPIVQLGVHPGALLDAMVALTPKDNEGELIMRTEIKNLVQQALMMGWDCPVCRDTGDRDKTNGFGRRLGRVGSSVMSLDSGRGSTLGKSVRIAV
ncbi:Vacuolar protein sorting-associated protein 41 [Chytridiales sp. JEL 0842]|nr:Vacuolar protein sorting-associated protein 41 [Chytridiales sp. JEL 0842]